MLKKEVIDALLDSGVNFVLSASSKEQALKVAEAILKGGGFVVEVSVNLPKAFELISTLNDEFGKDLMLGAGTVIDAETARLAIINGARFIVGPRTDEAMIRLCQRYDAAVCPGVLTPTEIIRAWELGADVAKVFPAYSVGGAKYIKTLKGPLPQIILMPTGGVDYETAPEFIKAGADCITIGGAVIDKKALKSGDYDVITKNVKRILKIVKEARF